MKFSKEKHLTFEEAVEIMFHQLGDWKIMALAGAASRWRALPKTRDWWQ